jgi:hypothetical protein
MLIFVASRSARRQKWQRHLLKQEQRRNPNFPPELSGAVGSAEGKGGISANLIFAAFVSENWPVKEKYRE